MFELIVEILHSDNRWTREPYSECQIVRNVETGERFRKCNAFRYSTHDACLVQIDKLNNDWLASRSTNEALRDWVEWRMQCKQVDGAPIS